MFFENVEDDNIVHGFRGKYSFLSNFYSSVIVYDNIKASTVEHHYQALKTLDEGERGFIYSLETPGMAKRAGSRVSMRADWNSIKYSLMYELTLLKYSQNDDLLKLLIATGDKKIIEENYWHDTYWGVCSCDSHFYSGNNNLGKIIMKVRDELS